VERILLRHCDGFVPSLLSSNIFDNETTNALQAESNGTFTKVPPDLKRFYLGQVYCPAVSGCPRTCNQRLWIRNCRDLPIVAFHMILEFGGNANVILLDVVNRITCPCPFAIGENVRRADDVPCKYIRSQARDSYDLFAASQVL
jgi:hypothetical protein